MEKTEVLTNGELWFQVFDQAAAGALRFFEESAKWALTNLGHDPAEYWNQIISLDEYFAFSVEEQIVCETVGGEELVSLWESEIPTLAQV